MGFQQLRTTSETRSSAVVDVSQNDVRQIPAKGRGRYKNLRNNIIYENNGGVDDEASGGA